MRALIQRVKSASVTVDGILISEISVGLLILLGIGHDDDLSDISWLCGKISKMRIFPDEEGKMNHSVVDMGGEIMVVSQFTLHASTKKGNRPSFLAAAPSQLSEPLYNAFCVELSKRGCRPVMRGRFGADMQIALVNDGPATIWIDSKQRE